MEIENLLEQLNNFDESEDKVLDKLVGKEAAKLGLNFDFDKNEEIKMNTNDLLAICDAMYGLGFEDGANDKINEAVERYLSVEYNEANPDKQTLVLYNGVAIEDSIEIDLENPLKTPDSEVRKIAKEHFSNITDDIRVAWY